MDYKIERPPLTPNFYLPSRNDLLKLKTNDIVKVMFSFRGDFERMWVILSDSKDIDKWSGYLDNDPVGGQLSQVLKSGDLVEFHPLDIIDIYHDSWLEKLKSFLFKKTTKKYLELKKYE